jgi:arylesterase / paraoxonase
MDVVPSQDDPETLLVYVVSHQPSLDGEPGSDSVVEVFRTRVGRNTLSHVRTAEDSVIDTPHDIWMGRALMSLMTIAQGLDMRVLDCFYTEPDLMFALLQTRKIDETFSRPTTVVGDCHLDKGCKIAARGLVASNSIVRGKDERMYVVNSKQGKISVFEEEDHKLVKVDEIVLGEHIFGLEVLC